MNPQPSAQIRVSATKALRSNGVSDIRMELNRGNRNDYGALPFELKKELLTMFSDDQPFIIAATVRDRSGKEELAGLVDALYCRPPELPSSPGLPQRYIYLHRFFVYPQFSGCGLGTILLEQMPPLVDTAFKEKAEAILLALCPQKIDENGKLVEVPAGAEYDAKSLELLQFYVKRGFLPAQADHFLFKMLK